MERSRIVEVAIVGLAIFMSGCLHVQPSDQPRTIYSSLDSTALVYSDPEAASDLDDHPLRWGAFALHPVGVGMEYVVNRPVRGFASTSPALFGYTAEDAQLDSQQPKLGRKPH